MDFSLIERHPWLTTAIVGVGALIVYVVLRGRSSGGGASYQGATTVQSDPNASAAALAQYQTQAQLQGLGIQSQTQLGLAGIAAGPNYSVQRSADSQDLVTAAQLQAQLTTVQAQLALGLNTQTSQVEMAKIQAGITGKYIDAIIAAFGGHTSDSSSPIQGTTPGYNPTPTVPDTFSPVTGNAVTQPFLQSPSPSQVNTTSPTLNGTWYDSNGYIVAGSSPLPGGVPVQSTPFVPTMCDPRDVACVMGNQNRSIAYYTQVGDNQAINNRNQCLVNAERNKGMPNYAALIAACG